jgi:hypothetical protein
MKKSDLDQFNRDTGTMEKVFELAVKELEEVLSHKKPPTDLTRIASNTASTYGKLKSAEIHDKALWILIARKDLKLIE